MCIIQPYGQNRMKFYLQFFFHTNAHLTWMAILVEEGFGHCGGAEDRKIQHPVHLQRMLVTQITTVRKNSMERLNKHQENLRLLHMSKLDFYLLIQALETSILFISTQSHQGFLIDTSKRIFPTLCLHLFLCNHFVSISLNDTCYRKQKRVEEHCRNNTKCKVSLSVFREGRQPLRVFG